MPAPQPYLTFDGNCAEAMRFYERTLGGRLEALLTWKDSPMAAQMPPGAGERIMHAHLAFDGGALLASDSMPGQPYEGMKHVALSLQFASLDEARRVFDALAEGGRITMPLARTFWSEGFGMCVDRYGASWMVNVAH